MENVDAKIDVLVVDDKQENLLALSAVLNSPRYNLILRASGEEALRYLLTHECAIILLDVQMPGMDGFETARIIKQREKSRNIPIIFITAINKDERFVNSGYSHGAVDYIFKPFEAEILRSKVTVFADLFESRREVSRQAELLREKEAKERERAIADLELRSLKREQAIQAKYKDLVDGIKHGLIWVIDPVYFNCQFVSPSSEDILGFPLDAWSKEPGFWKKHLHPDDMSRVVNAVRLLDVEGDEVEIEHRFLGNKGETHWFQSGIRLANRSDGQGLELRGLSVDVTRLKRVEESLRLNEERLKYLARASYFLSQSLDFTETLNKVAQLTVPGLADFYSLDILNSEDQFTNLATNFRGSASAFQLEDLEETARRVIHSGRYEFYGPTESDTSLALSVPLATRGKQWGVLTLAFGSSGRSFSKRDISIVEDIAERMAISIENARLFRESQDTIRVRDQFLSIASHELRTPLTPIQLNTQMMLRNFSSRQSIENLHKNPGQVDQLIRMMQSSDRQVKRISRLIDDLLDISRIRTGKLDLSLEDFDLGELLKTVVEGFSGQFSENGYTVKLSIKGHAVGRWDRFRIEQVVVNLLTNAMKYGEGRPIVIELDCKNSLARLTVRDQGIGIAVEDQNRIFERFERAVPAANYGGLGLGLYISSEIVRAHGGKIRVESQVGKGSSFTLELPCGLNIQKVNGSLYSDSMAQ